MAPNRSTPKKDVSVILPAMLNKLEPLQDKIAARCRAMPGSYIEFLKNEFDKFEPEFSLAPFIQGNLVAAATLGKKRMLVFLRGDIGKAFPRYVAHWQSCVAERNNAKSFVEDMTGVPMITEVMDFFKTSRSKKLRMLVSHLDSLEDGSSKNVTNDASSVLAYKMAAANERLNSWTVISDECDTYFQRLEDSTSSSEARYLATNWDAGRRLSKGDGVTDCLAMRWQLILFLIMQPSLKIREVIFEQETKPIGVSLRAVASTYRKPKQEWESNQEFNAAEEYRNFSKKRAKAISPLRENFFDLLCALLIVANVFPDSALQAHPAGVKTSNTPSSAGLVVGARGPRARAPLMIVEEEEEDEDGMGVGTEEPASAGVAGSAELSHDAARSLAGAKANLPSLKDQFGDDDYDDLYTPTDMQSKLDRQERLWQDQSARLYPADDGAHSLMGSLLSKYDALSTGEGLAPQQVTKRDVYERGISVHCCRSLT